MLNLYGEDVEISNNWLIDHFPKTTKDGIDASTVIAKIDLELLAEAKKITLPHGDLNENFCTTLPRKIWVEYELYTVKYDKTYQYFIVEGVDEDLLNKEQKEVFSLLCQEIIFELKEKLMEYAEVYAEWEHGTIVKDREVFIISL